MRFEVRTVWGKGITEKVVWHVVKESQPSWVCRSLRRMTYAGPAPVCVIPQAAKWNKSNFCWVTFQCKQRRSISAASSDCAELSTADRY